MLLQRELIDLLEWCSLPPPSWVKHPLERRDLPSAARQWALRSDAASYPGLQHFIPGVSTEEMKAKVLQVVIEATESGKLNTTDRDRLPVA